MNFSLKFITSIQPITSFIDRRIRKNLNECVLKMRIIPKNYNGNVGYKLRKNYMKKKKNVGINPN
jgi:hypothetical protein